MTTPNEQLRKELIDSASSPTRTPAQTTLQTPPVTKTAPVQTLPSQSPGSRNEDPLTGEKGAHPIGTGLGAALGGAAAGAAAGTVAGPLGTIAGTLIGGIAGAFAGKAVAESIDPTVESDYWRTEFRNRPYFRQDATYETYEPAYRAGWESYTPDAHWETAEPLAKKKWEENWESEGGAPTLTWEEAKAAAQDAYHRVHAQGR